MRKHDASASSAHDSSLRDPQEHPNRNPIPITEVFGAQRLMEYCLRSILAPGRAPHTNPAEIIGCQRKLCTAAQQETRVRYILRKR